MLVKELVTILEEVNPDYSRQALLDEIDYVVREVFSSRLNYNRAVDSATGLDPIITPSSSPHTISNCSGISKVYKNDFDFTEYKIVGNQIYFKPEQLGSDYYVTYFKRTDILSESQTLPIPDELVSTLEDGVSARIQVKQHGQQQVWREWKKYDLPNLRRKLNNNYKWGVSGSEIIQSYQ